MRAIAPGRAVPLRHVCHLRYQDLGADDERSSVWRFEKSFAENWILALLPRVPVAEFPATHAIDLLGLVLVTSWASFIDSAVVWQALGE